MELDPTTENGKRLSPLMTAWLAKTADQAVDMIKRMFLMWSSKMINEDAFLAALYGQRVLDETPLNLREHLTTALLRVQHAIEMSCNNRRLKELVVALEWSENQTVLTEILKWAEEASKKDVMDGIQNLDLAPQRVERSLSTLFSRGPTAQPVKPRDREIRWSGFKRLSALAVCGNKIIIGFDSGEIKIYSSVDLQCQTTLPCCHQKVSVKCLQCTCTEIIAGYEYGLVCVWNIQSGLMVKTTKTFEERTNLDKSESVACMRWSKPNLALGKDNGKVGMWQWSNASFVFLGEWNSNVDRVKKVELDLDYIIVLGYGTLAHSKQPTKFQRPSANPGNFSSVLQGNLAYSGVDPIVFTFNGRRLFSIGKSEKTWDMKFHDGRLITADLDGMVRIWDVSRALCLRELRGQPDSEILSVDAQYKFIVSGDRGGGIVIWSVEAALKGNFAELIRLPGQFGLSDTFLHGPHKIFPLAVGKNFIAKCNGGSPDVVVTDFS